VPHLARLEQRSNQERASQSVLAPGPAHEEQANPTPILASPRGWVVSL
jgi:hypothetical protein